MFLNQDCYGYLNCNCSSFFESSLLNSHIGHTSVRALRNLPATVPISMNTSCPQELVTPKARRWLRSITIAANCSSEQTSLNWPNHSTALLWPAGGITQKHSIQGKKRSAIGQERYNFLDIASLIHKYYREAPPLLVDHQPKAVCRKTVETCTRLIRKTMRILT